MFLYIKVVLAAVIIFVILGYSIDFILRDELNAGPKMVSFIPYLSILYAIIAYFILYKT